MSEPTPTLDREDVIAAMRSGKYARDVTWLRNLTIEGLNIGYRDEGDAFTTTAFTHMVYEKRGVQVRVQKEVSDDMLLSDLGDVKFGEIPWPAAGVEMFFEDPTLPTVVLAKTSAAELERMLPGLEIKAPPGMTQEQVREERVMLAMQSAEGVCLTFNLLQSVWDLTVNEGAMLNFDKAVALEADEHAVMKEMLRLALKVFAYASLPHYQPEPVREITKKMGGKPGFKERPARPALRVIYAPNLHTPREAGSGEHEVTGKTHRFLGRRGYFRTYRHERYREMRGKRVYIGPIKVAVAPPPTTIVVRKI